MDSRFSSSQWLCKGMKGLHQGKGALIQPEWYTPLWEREVGVGRWRGQGKRQSARWGGSRETKGSKKEREALAPFSPLLPPRGGLRNF